MRGRTAAPAAVALVALLVPLALVAGCGGRSGGDDRTAGTTRPSGPAGAVPGMVPHPPIVVGSLSLPDAAAAPPRDVGFHAEPGHILIAYFGYTSCPDVCPTALADLGAALDLLKPADRKRVQVAMVTVDPERDTASVMRRYVGHFFDGAHALRTDDPELQQAVQAAFGVQVSRKPPGPDGDYAVDHTSALFPVDAGGKVQVMWLTGMEPREIADAISALLRRVADPSRVSGILVGDASVVAGAQGTATVSFTLRNAGGGADELRAVRVPVEVAGGADLPAPVALPPGAEVRVGDGAPGPVLSGLAGPLVPGRPVPLELTFGRSATQTVFARTAG